MSFEFLTLLEPLITPARARLRADLERMRMAGARPFPADVAVIESWLFDGIASHLAQIITPTLALEMNVARLRGRLNGQTPEERYASYVTLLADADYRASLSAEYPALFDMAAARLDTWVNVSLELVSRLSRDWAALEKTLFLNKSPGELVRMRFMQRTTKRGGRSVVALTFDSGAKLVYKPRSLAVELRFQELIDWLNRVGFEPEFKPIRLLDLGTHGWMQWIEAAECDGEYALRRFYRRQGAYLALFYALEATDIHMSNVIAAGEHPMFIDMEALFHPRETPGDWPPLELALDQRSYYSVLRPGLLPEPEKDEDEQLAPMDLSGLAGSGGQLTPFFVSTWKERNTDTLHLARERKLIKGSQNLPTRFGRPVNPADYIDDLDQGFSAAYQLMTIHKADLLSPGGRLAAFAETEIRVLARSGRNYGEILDAGHHPDLLRNPTTRAKYIEKRLHRDVADQPEVAALIPHEMGDLLAGDVPLFTAQAGSRDMMTSNGVRLPEFFPRSGLEMAQKRVTMMDERDLNRQRWFLRASFATVAPIDVQPGRRPIDLPDEAPTDLGDQALAAALAIGEWLSANAIVAGDEASWIGLEPDEAGHWFVEPLGDDLGFGLPGVALFLCRLAAQTGDDRWHGLGGAAMNTWLRYLAEDRAEEDEDDLDDPIGLLFGLGGQLVALSHLAEAYPDLEDEISVLVQRAASLLKTEDIEYETGLAHGLAGCLIGLLAAHFVAHDPAALAVAKLAGSRLIAHLEEEANAVTGDPFMALFDGPRAGVASLFALAAATGDSPDFPAAGDILAQVQEGGHDDPGLWPAYLAVRSWLPDHQREVGDEALRRLLPPWVARQSGANHSLWNGDLGNIDLLLSAAAALDDATLAQLAARYAAAVIGDIHKHGWRSANPLAVESPGLATGLAGIGYGLLRVVAPESIKPLLSFVPQSGVV